MVQAPVAPKNAILGGFERVEEDIVVNMDTKEKIGISVLKTLVTVATTYAVVKVFNLGFELSVLVVPRRLVVSSYIYITIRRA